MNEHPIVIFKYFARYGHFLKAEASASGLTYSVPSKTTLFGLAGAILGLDKDISQEELCEARFAVSGPRPTTHWHKAKLRKDPPSEIPWIVKHGEKGTQKPEKATLPTQEWLFNPSYTVIAYLPDKYHDDFVRRIKNKEYYYTPCMGLSEMIAELDFLTEGISRPSGFNKIINCCTLAKANYCSFEPRLVLEEGNYINIQRITLPDSVTKDRIFSHADYFYEVLGQSIPVETSIGWEVKLSNKVMEYMYL